MAPAVGGLLDRVDQFLWLRVLAHVAVGPANDRPVELLVIHVAGEDDERAVGHFAAQLAHAVHRFCVGGVDIHEHHVGLVGAHDGHGSGNVVRLADHGDTIVVFEQRADSGTKNRMLIDDQELDRTCSASTATPKVGLARPALFSCHGAPILRP